jgi:putative component of toxin-antitoxin plasmid stabilization module
MSDEATPIQLLFSDEFKACLRSLTKRYRKIQSDLQPRLEDLQSGNFGGDRISGTGENPVFKIRLKIATSGKATALDIGSYMKSEIQSASC